MQGGDRQGRAGGPGERLDWVLACLMTAGFSAPGMILLGASQDPAPPTPALRLYWLPVYALGFVLLARRWRRVGGAWAIGLALAAPVVWAFLSKQWSIAPEDTGRRAMALALTTLLGLALGAGFAPRELPRIVAAALVALALGSAAMALGLPRYGVEQDVNAGCWRGLWLTKNALAAYMGVGVLAALCAAEGSRRPWAWLAGCGVCAFDLAMSRGKTGLVCLVLALGLLAVRRIGRGGPARAVVAAWAAGTGALAAGVLAGVLPQLLFKAVGKDATLTGRTQIWNAVLDQVTQRPLTGFGFAAFWTLGSVPAKIVSKRTGWAVPEAHNAWVDLLAGLGWVGAALTAAGCLAGVWLALARMRGRGDGLFALAYMVMVLASSVAESVILEGNNIIWMVFVALVGSVATFRAGRPALPPQPVAAWPIAPSATGGVLLSRP